MRINPDKPLGQLLSEYAMETDDARRESVKEMIWQQYGQVGTVMVLDMSGFSVVTRTSGIVYYMSLIYRMQQAVLPAIQSHAGKLVKFEADNCFATYPDSDAALKSALDIHEAIKQANSVTPQDHDIEISIGIDHGQYLSLDEADFFGDPVNRASKLGEDLGCSGEILMTRESYEALSEEHPVMFEDIRFSISGLQLDAVHVRRHADG